MSEAHRVHLGSSEFNEAKRLQALLEERGVEISLISEPHSCGPKSKGGCKITVEVYAHEIDVPKIREFLQEQKAKALDGLDVDASLLEEVYDPEQATARCPACGTQFSTTSAECPDCGLVFAAGIE